MGRKEEARPKTAMEKKNINFSRQMLDDFQLAEELTGRSFSELVRDFAAKGLMDILEHHLLKRESIS